MAKKTKNKKIKAVIFLTSIALVFFVLPGRGLGSEREIKITEIMYNPEGADSKREWVEIKNSGAESINLEGWKFFEAGTNHSLGIVQGEWEIGSGDFAVIADDASAFLGEYPNCGETIFDSSFSLKNSGEEISIKNSEGTVIDFILYFPIGAEGYSVEKNEEGLWQSSCQKGGSPGEVNCLGDPQNKDYSNLVMISELFPNPSHSPEKKYEFVEIYNYGEEKINLNDWKIKDKIGKFDLFGSIGAGERVVFYDTVSLNNSGDKIYLENPNGEVISSVEYAKADENFSYSFDSVARKWKWSSYLTPGEESVFDKEKTYAGTIYINEILPNPSGEEKTKEYIEIYNYGEKEVDISGWILRDSSKSSKFIFPSASIVGSGKYLVISRKEFSFALNNTGAESVFLLNPDGKIISSVSYQESAKEDVSYNFDGEMWRWSKKISPGKRNKFNDLPKIEVKIDKKAYKDVYVDFEVKVNDPDKDDVKVVWNFGDGRKSYKEKTRHKYGEKGKYKGSVKIFDGSEEKVKKFTIDVKKFPEPNVKIIRILPNPKGKDVDGEWIEVENKYKKEINLKGWSIATGSSSKKMGNHPIREDITIEAGKSRILTRKDSNFSLNNKKARIELRYPNGKVAYRIKYSRDSAVKEDEVYEKTEGEKWEWAKLAGRIIPEEKQEDENVLYLEVQKENILEGAEIEDNSSSREIFLEGMTENPENKDETPKIFLVMESENEDLVLLIEKGLEVESYNIEERGGIYFFTRKISSKDHYVKEFLEELAIKINGYFNQHLGRY